jgi:hypothetical protein
MENVTAKSAATTEQLYDSHSGVQQQLTKMATQVADTNADFRENRKCTLAARMEELVQHSPPSTRNTSSIRGVVYTASPPPGPSTPQIRVDLL